jgi:hypothetical protein
MAFFWLLPRSEEACRIAEDPLNSGFQGHSPTGKLALRVPLAHTSKRPGGLICFGRDPNVCDIILGSSKYYSKVHCYFYINIESGELVLQDESSTHTTDLVVEEDDRYALQGKPRRRVIPDSMTPIIGIHQAVFELVGYDKVLDAQEAKEHVARQLNYLSRTSIEKRSLLPPAHNTRVSTPDLPKTVQLVTKVVHQPRKAMGGGAYGTVRLTVDLDSGNLLAVKQFRIEPSEEKPRKEQARKEVMILAKLEHVSELVTHGGFSDFL